MHLCTSPDCGISRIPPRDATGPDGIKLLFEVSSRLLSVAQAPQHPRFWSRSAEVSDRYDSVNALTIGAGKEEEVKMVCLRTGINEILFFERFE